MGTKDLAERAGGHFTAQTVDIDLLIFMLLAHEVLLSLGMQWTAGEWAGWEGGQGPGRGAKRVRPPEHFSFRLHQPLPPSVPRQLLLWLGRRVTSSSLEEQSCIRGAGGLDPRVVSTPGGREFPREGGHGGLARAFWWTASPSQVKGGSADQESEAA